MPALFREALTYLILTFLLERQGWTEIRIHDVMSSPVNGCVFTQSHEGRVTENPAHLCILPLQRTHTDCVHVCVHTQVQLFATPWTVAHQAPLSMVFSRQEHWSRLPFPTPGDLPDPGMDQTCISWVPALAGRFFTSWPSGKPSYRLVWNNCWQSQPLGWIVL